MRRWIGIDEAGYGPNLGPLVMTAVVAEDLNPSQSYPVPPDIWKDLSPKVARAGGEAGCLWIDDSKLVYRGTGGRERLESACSLAIEAAGLLAPKSFGALCQSLQAGDSHTCEFARWLPSGGSEWPWPRASSLEIMTRLRPISPLSPTNSAWKIAEVRSVVVGPERFNTALAETGSKARVHFRAFAELLRPLWNQTLDGDSTHLTSDKHGGRHFYLEPLRDVFQEAWIERGEEGPALSRYQVREGMRSMELRFTPRADAENGLVALASLVSKAVREAWMDAFNAFWKNRIPELKPTAGYPQDASRFRRQIDGLAKDLGLEPRLWWREK